jgi:hypothetical protein
MAAPRGFEPPDLLPEPSDPSAHPEPNARPRRESLARYSLAPSQRHYAAQVQPPRPRIDEDVLQRLAGLGDIGSQLQASCAHSCHGPMLSAAGLLLSIAADPVSHACVATISLVSGSGSGSLTETAAVATERNSQLRWGRRPSMTWSSRWAARGCSAGVPATVKIPTR